MKKYLDLAFIILCWSINPHIKKHIMLKKSQLHYYYINSIVMTTLVNLMYLWFYHNGIFQPADFEFPNFKQWSFIILSACISIFTTFYTTRLIHNFKISKLIPKLQPFVIVITVLIGHFKGDTLTFTQWLGILFIFIGMYCTL